MASDLITQMITKKHDAREFQCARPKLADYLKRYARQTTERGGARTFVVTLEDKPNTVIGYYTLVPSEMAAEEVPPEARKGLGRYPLPGFRMARLAVDNRYEGRRLGPRLMLDAGLRCLRAAEQVGGVVMFIDAKDDKAASFYCHHGVAQLIKSRPLLLIWRLDMISAGLDRA